MTELNQEPSRTGRGAWRLPTDPITFEMIKHKLLMVIAEAMDALKNVSGSPSTSEALDMMVSLYDEDGGLMLGGVGFTHHITSAAQAVKHLLREYGTDPGINEDDAYFLNDPYIAALHAPDVYIISPIHHDQTLIGFVANFVHVTDIGGVDPGGFCPNASESYQEGFQTRGLKLVDHGTVRRDVLDTILNMVRDPQMTQLDLKSQLAANHVAKERIARLIADFGEDQVRSVAEALIDQSEDQMKARLRSLPDGQWTARQYVDAADQLVKVELRATKTGDELLYDFTGTSDQLVIGINATYWASWGAVLAPVFPQLAWDLTWNEGIIRPIRMIAPEGTVVNAIKPAPTSIATVGIVQVVNNLSTIISSKMLGVSRDFRERATGVWHGSHASVRLHGHRANGTYYISALTDTFAGAGGAMATRDGIDMGGELANVVSRWGNVEKHELMAPVRYLFRRRVTDSGGPGKYRGGLAHEFGFTVEREAAPDGFQVTLFGKGVRSPMSVGIFGGYPGCPIGYALFRDLEHSEMLEHPAAHDPRAQDHLSWGTFTMHPGDLQVIRYNGGGGYGDPLDRDPKAVVRDVADGAVSLEAARRVYGVVIDAENMALDPPATEERRRLVRAERVRKAPDRLPSRPTAVLETGMWISEYLQRTLSGKVQCTWCGADVAPPGVPWKSVVPVNSSPISRVHPNSYDDQAVRLREYFCGGCGTLLECEPIRGNDTPLHDDIYTWPNQSDHNEQAAS